MKKMILALLCVSLAIPAYAGATGLTVSNPQTDGNGVVSYDAASANNGPGTTTLRILAPTSPAQVTHRFIYVLPVAPNAEDQDLFGDGLEELRALNVHNLYNAHVIAPSFHVVPWYADHDSIPDRRYESFLVNDLAPWVQANLGVTGQEEHWLVGMSKSGFGAVTLLFRNPTSFSAAAAWDFPAEQPDTNEFDMPDNYGTEPSETASPAPSPGPCASRSSRTAHGEGPADRHSLLRLLLPLGADISSASFLHQVRSGRNERNGVLDPTVELSRGVGEIAIADIAAAPLPCKTFHTSIPV